MDEGALGSAPSHERDGPDAGRTGRLVVHRSRSLTRVLSSGAGGAVRAAVLIFFATLAAIPLVQLGTQWYVRGSTDILPATTSARATEADLVTQGATPAERLRIAEALAGLRYPLPLRGVTFVVTPSPCPDCAGEYVPGLQIVRVERAVADGGGLQLQYTLAHELGHFVDDRFGTDRMRTRFRTLRGIPSDLPWEAPNSPWAQRPVEDFAEVFAVMDVPIVEAPPQTVYGPVNDPAAMEDLLAGIGVRQSVAREPMGWRRLFALEVSFLGALFTDPAFVGPALVIIATGAAVGAVIGVWVELRGA